MSVEKAYQEIAKTVPKNVQLVAVSKTKPIELIERVYSEGQRHFGENKVQELTWKAEELQALDIQWHMIGHLQSNKVKYIAPFVHLIHGVDSFKLLKEINKQGQKNDRTISCLLQFHIATESTKFGLTLEEAQQFLSSDAFLELSNVRIEGVMGMATFTSNEEQVKSEFRTLKNIFDRLKDQFFSSSENFEIISMGMSGDYSLAIGEGSTMIRVGSSIFGTR